MKKNILYIALAVSVLTNICVLAVVLTKGSFGSSDKEEPKEQVDSLADPNCRLRTAEKVMRKLVCDNLYYPNSYDPVNTQVDSVFYNYLTDKACLKAATDLIEMRASYESAKESYEQNVNDIKVFGGSGVFRDLTVNRNKAAAEMKELKPKIEKCESIIKNRDTSNDGKFIGWQVIHRYRASNSDGVVSFGDVLYILSPDMTRYLFRFSLDERDKNNLTAIKKALDKELGFNEEE